MFTLIFRILYHTLNTLKLYCYEKDNYFTSMSTFYSGFQYY
jgi:hypothetical protein